MGDTHAVQLAVVAVACVLDVVGLLVLNRYKANCPAGCSWSWLQKRNAYWMLMATLTGLATWLDLHYPIGTYFLPVKAYAFAFLVGLLDLFFSETRGVPLRVIPGATLWCSTILLRQLLVDACWPNGGAGLPPLIVREVTGRTVLVEMFRYIVTLASVGLLSDLIFSPMHRLAHHPSLYKGHHKVHHEFTNKLTSLVLYHGALLDDFLMPATTTIGGFLFVALLGLGGLESQAFSNVTGYVIVCNTLMSHASDVRCARLLAPLPDSVNFVAYHYVHHLSPSTNYGLTEPSDRLWDWVLGVRTIRKLEEFVPGADKKDG